MHPEAPLAGPEKIALLGSLADLAEQAAENRLVHSRVTLGTLRRLAGFGLLTQDHVDLGVGGRLHRALRRLAAVRCLGAGLAGCQLQILGQQHQLAMGIAPFAQAHVVEEVLLAPGAQRVGAQFLAFFLEAAPQIDQCGEVGIDILPLRVGLVGRLLAVHRPLARVLHGQRTGDDQQFRQAAQLGRFEHHAAQARVDGQARQLATQWRQLAFSIDRRKLLQEVETIADGLAIRWLDKGEILDAAQAQMEHLQDHRRQVGTQDFRIGEARPAEEILLAVQAHADARLDPPATALALVGAGLGNRLDGQALHLGAVAVAADARGAAVDHVTNAGHRQRGFRHVGGQHDLAPGHGREDLLLLGRRQPRIQRQHFGKAQVGLAQYLGSIANLALAGQEDQHIAGALADALLMGGDFIQRSENGLVDGQVVE